MNQPQQGTPAGRPAPVSRKNGLPLLRRATRFDSDGKALTAIAIVAGFVFLILAAHSFLTNIYWPARLIERMTTPFDLRSAGLVAASIKGSPGQAAASSLESATLTVQYPGVLPFQGVRSMEVIYQPNGNEVLAFSLEITTASDDIRFLRQGETVPVDRVTLAFPLPEGKRETIRLLNQKQRNGIFTAPASFSLRLLDETGRPLGTEETARLEVETSLIATLAALKSQPSGSPLLVSTGLVSLLSLLYKIILGFEKKAAEKKETARREIVEKFRLVREHLRGGNMAEASRKLDEVSAQAKSLGDPAWNEDEVRTARAILQVGNGAIPDKQSWSELAGRWPDEAAGALIHAAGAVPESRKGQVTGLLRGFPVERCSPEMEAAVAAAREKYKKATPVQGREWPFCRKEIQEQQPLRLPGAMKLGDPFLRERAEEDSYWLFLHPRPLFWADLPVYREYAWNSAHFCCMVGEEGSGKTAMALALSRYADTPYTIGVYQTGCPETGDLFLALAERLLVFIRRHPTHLQYLGRSERALLARLLRRYFHSEFLQAELERMAHFETWDWPSQAEGEEQKNQWIAEAITQIRLLRRSLEDQAGKGILPEREWPFAFRHVCQALEFQKVTIAIDASPLAGPAWFQELRERANNCWSLAGLQTFVFCQESTIARWRQDGMALDGDVREEQLCWIEEGHSWLREMIEYRWKALNPHVDLSAFTGERLDELVGRANGNPGAFMKQWRAFVAEKRGNR